MTSIPVEFPTDWTEYELVDSGDGDKLERFGPHRQPVENEYIMIRPDPRILWQKTSPDSWTNPNASYTRTGSDSGIWIIHNAPPDPWHIHYQKLTFTLKPTEFKHTGVFPEQAVNWNWITQQIHSQPLKVLNLFAYTGGATMASMSAGAHVTHVDSVKSALLWARENIQASHLDTNLIRYIEDDVMKFVLREQRRESKYDGIIMDPPRFGRGPKGEVWKLNSDLPKLLHTAVSLLSPDARFLVINAYTADFSAVALSNLVADIFKSRGGTITFGELALQESIGKRLVPQGIFVRWSNET